MTRTYRAEAILSAKDATGPGLRSAAQRLQRFQNQVDRANRMADRAAPMSRASRTMMQAQGRVSALALAGRLAAPIGVGVGIKSMTNEALSFERTMYDVQKATNSSNEDLKGYEKAVFDLARATGKTKEELGGILAAAGYAGRPVHELTRFTEYAAKATTAWGTSADVTGQSLAEIGNIYQANQQRIEEIGDAVNYVADNAAAKETDLLDFLRRSGATGRQMGLSAEQTMAFGASLKEIGTPTEVAATGFNALMNAMALGDDFTAKAGEGFKALGINSKKMQKDFSAKPLETTLSFLEKLSQVKDPLKRAKITTDIFGKEYGDDIARMTGNLEGLRRILGLVADKANYLGSVTKGFELIKEKDFNKIARAEEALKALGHTTSNAFKEVAGSVAEGINQFVDATEKGENFFQRMEARRQAYNRAMYGTDKTPDEIQEEKDLEDTRQFYADLWNKIVSLVPSTRADAEQEGIRAAVEERFKEQEVVLERSGKAAENYQQSVAYRDMAQSDQTRAYREVRVKKAEQIWAFAQEDSRRIHQQRASNAQSIPALEAAIDSQNRLHSLTAGQPVNPEDVLNGKAAGPGPGLLSFGLGRNGEGSPSTGNSSGPVVAQLEGQATVGVQVELAPNSMFDARVKTLVRQEVGHLRVNAGGGGGAGVNTGQSMPEVGGL